MKLKRGISGRKQTFRILNETISEQDKTMWFHCASLGEYEQGLPVFEELQKIYPIYKIVLSFFSPSGFEIRKKSSIAHTVVYLPFDTSGNAKKFIEIVHPEIVIFVKYEIWPNYLSELKTRKIRTLLISALFRKNQIYFRWYGTLMKISLKAFEHIFVQDERSATLLDSIQFRNVTVSGDTRFDRVSNQLKLDNKLESIAAFIDGKTCMVAGSTWPDDEALLINFINEKPSGKIKFIIAPHNIKPDQIDEFQKKLKVKTVLYSERNNKNLAQFDVFIIDMIGILSKVYSYADIAYVGGAVGKTGLHNTLEPAIFGIPIIIGNNHKKFPEAENMISNGGMFSITNKSELNTILTKLLEDKRFRLTSGNNNKNFIEENRGAVIQIMNYIRTYA